MSNKTPETIIKYEVMFAVRTGVTVMLPKVAAFDCGAKTPISFMVSPDNPQDVLINADSSSVLLKNMNKDHLDAAIERGFILFYETKDDEVIRCTHCNYQKN